MRLICSVFILVIFGQYGFSQFFNNGATVTIQPGATLKVETSFTNDNSGTFTNNGVLEVTGNFTNSATFTSGASSEVKFSGNANSTVTPGTAQFQNVTMAKTAANVVLAGNATVNGVLNFSTANNKIVLGMHNLTMGSMGSVTGAGSDKYVVATGAGRMIKPIAANSTLVFEVGDNDVSTNYSPLSANITGSSYSGASVGVNVVNAVHPNLPGGTNDYITRYWDVLATGTINGYSNIMTGTYVASDINGSQPSIDGAAWNGSAWSYTNASHSGNTITVTTTVLDVELTGLAREIALNTKVFLTNTTSGTMSDGLRSLATFPLTDVYTTAPYSSSSLFTYVPAQTPATTTLGVLSANNVVDWILSNCVLDLLRGTTVVASKAGLLKNDGIIINPDGTPFSFAGSSRKL
ncbi:MAG: hypothetical protein IPI53_13745 [Saprospiraceae bacterium]|nr:hypothetical protein [Saprospiraceae bacterium]